MYNVMTMKETNVTVTQQMSYSGSLLIGSHKVVVSDVDEIKTRTDSHSSLINCTTST